jgi:hypothetical protein
VVELDAPTGSESSRPVRHSEALAWLSTGVRQLDQLAGLGADAIVHAEPLPLDAVVVAVDTIAGRMSAALSAVGASS